jgi:hypothetical protein
LAAFAVLYVGSLWVRWRSSRPRASYWLLGALGAVTLALSIGFGQGMAALFPLLSIACGAVVPWVVPKSGHGPPAPLLVVFIVAAASMFIAIAQGASPGNIWSGWYGPALSGLVVALIYRFIEAVAEQQAMDIEDIGRGALSEVRQAVAGYRGRGLARELEAARAALADAGITAEVLQDGPPVPAGADALLGWVVREGVTLTSGGCPGFQAGEESGAARRVADVLQP